MVHGVGLGFRRELSDKLLSYEGDLPRFVEFAPENWMNIGGFWRKKLIEIAEKYTILTHGLSLSIGSPDPLNMDFLRELKRFFKEVPVQIYSEHLSYSQCDNAHLHELLPIPFREDAVRHISDRIRLVQDFLGRRIAIENVSYYTPVAAEMSESEFICSIVREADCDLLLDVNNVYVNAFNHKYDAKEFIQSLPLERVTYVHIAGHEQRTPELIIDTHGHPIIDPVFDLFAWTIPQLPEVPVLLERDFNIPDFNELLQEMERLQLLYDKGKQEAQDAA